MYQMYQMKKLLKKIASRILRQEIELMDFKLKAFIPLACTNSKFNGGIGAEVNTWVWDFYRAGIRAVGDRDFQMITEFLSASARVLS